uniref:Uncharacterized protein n=1 Tax=Anguilla anguilla TaxID=7936 RepID=A0A0E9RC56_ANGAN
MCVCTVCAYVPVCECTALCKSERPPFRLFSLQSIQFVGEFSSKFFSFSVRQ